MEKCLKHLKYNGKRLPKYECLECLNYYYKLKTGLRAPIKATIKHRDKSKYTRKIKHKKEEE